LSARFCGSGYGFGQRNPKCHLAPAHSLLAGRKKPGFLFVFSVVELDPKN
jgi:hypothetical protein